MHLRFVVAELDPDSGRRRGVFQAAAELRSGVQLSGSDRERLESLWTWFSDHLRRPSSFSTSRRPHAKAQAISWFSDTATEHIARMRELAAILDANGVSVEVVRTTRPGYVVYEDEVQVVAYPYADTPT